MRSTRCPGKLLYEACGKSILELQMERLQRVDVDHRNNAGLGGRRDRRCC